MTTSQTLIKARDLLQQGWCRGGFIKVSKGKERFCIAGAIYRAQPFQRAGDKCLHMVCAAGGIERHLIAQFNDAPGRKKSEILKLMDDAIELAKREESENETL